MPSNKKIPFSENHLIYKGKFWNVVLHRDNQSYLGRSVVYLKSRPLQDSLRCTKQEREELWSEILPRLVKALQKAFGPDRINYAHLANEAHFVHWHIVPRYEKNPIRKFAGEIFQDERPGKNYSPNASKKVKPSVMAKICSEIKKYIK